MNDDEAKLLARGDRHLVRDYRVLRRIVLDYRATVEERLAAQSTIDEIMEPSGWFDLDGWDDEIMEQ